MLLTIPFILLIVVKYGRFDQALQINFGSSPSEECTRIMGGYTCRSQPKNVGDDLIQLKIVSPRTKGYCGASLIASKWVLSAAHCFYDLDNGPFFAVKVNNIHKVKPVKVKEVFIHPEYETKHYRNDIALAYLETSLRGPFLKINTVKTELPCTIATAMGMGRLGTDPSAKNPSEPMCLNVSMLSIPHCSLLNGIPTRFMERKYCTTPGCYHGDSGAPLLCNDIQVGIVGTTDKKATKPVLYTRVDIFYESFIRPVTKYEL
ncbi:unnamed protein product [Psylliodes chrysocephalus]|uniref:Peptidase S1 domain-containing protein n=1 Tax=Psylliodes chrysocephalus TaxID=3402493 RepID=A0A9P0G5D4_9CUCU|nr:unnamed protein product [Psylliodes chrysocephala]